MKLTERELVFAFVSLVLVLALLIGLIVSNNNDKALQKNNFIVPKYAGVYQSLNEPISIAIFDLNDKNQRNMAGQVIQFFKNYNKGGQS